MGDDGCVSKPKKVQHSLSPVPPTQEELERTDDVEYPTARLVFLGAGSSSGIPTLSCLTNPADPPCRVCHEANDNPQSKNHRGNPSLLIQLCDETNVIRRNVLIDAGKTFASSVARFFPKFGVRGVDSLIVSHDHADAVFGMDDLRSVQYFRRGVGKATGRSLLDILRPIDTYCSDETMAQLKETYHYLFPKHEEDVEDGQEEEEGQLLDNDTTTASHPHHHHHHEEGKRAGDKEGAVENEQDTEAQKATSQDQDKSEPKRFVTKLHWNVIANLKDRSIDVDPPFAVHGLEMQPVRMFHGGTYICLGFLFGPEDAKVAYLSDVKEFPKATMDLLLQTNISILVLDCLYAKGEHNTHMSLDEAIDTVRQLKPKR